MRGAREGESSRRQKSERALEIKVREGVNAS
jgi:hypothetical protein